ncbi:unnamed protein product [Schistosoma rodhaini]|uniref:Uncharacterized protein n=1 Tax=Schistosoma rodhaini TaxID=6188 RepID=A0AA85EP76_9TREM|nr:unnamed protein product [Schistosoma rodhaini]
MTVYMFQFFSNALDTQNEELKLLHNKVTELERVNNEVLDFVHKNGRLPEIITDRENLELASDQDDISVYRGSGSNHGGKHRQLETVTRRSPNSSVLTGVISKDTEELSRELMSLGFESSKCNHIVDHVQENMDNLVSTDTTAYEPQLDFDKKTTCLTPQRGISSPISEIIDLTDHNASPTNPECSGDDSNKSQNYGQPQYSFPPTLSTVTYELRRRELLRANQRIVSNSSYSLNDSIESLTDHISYYQSIPSSLSVQLPSSECQAICIPCNNHSLHYSNSNSNPTMSLTDSVLHYCVSEKSNTDETNPNDYSLSCPCGNPQSCPLSEQKIKRLCKNPCIIHGFTILSAVFRGRLIRQLLATPKVHDLIRSVKDIAKLILSIKLENQLISMNKLNKQLCNKKLFFELNLLIKLYNILNEIHEIFFIWSLKQQISLISISSNVITKINNCSMNPISNNSLRILRQLQPHQVNSLPKNKQISNNVIGEEKKLNNSIIPNKQINFPAKNQFIQNENKFQIKNNSKFKTTILSNQIHDQYKQKKFYKQQLNINNQYFIKSISTNNNNNKLLNSNNRSINKVNNFSSKLIKPKIIRHFSNKVDLIRNNNTSVVDSLNDDRNKKNHSLNMVNCKLEANSKNDQHTSTLKSTNVCTDINNFRNIKTTHTDKCLETVVEEKRLSTSSKQVNSSTLSQCETSLHAPLINNNTSIQRCFPVKRRILSRKLQNDYSNTSVHINTQNNNVSFWIQDNQSINNTLHSNDNNNEIEHDCKMSNSELRATWTLDSKIYPSLTIDTTNLTN